VVRLIAARVDRNIRELEGSLVKIDALSQSQACPITLDLARAALGTEPSRPVMISTILEVVARKFNVRVSDIQGKKRAKTFTLPRHVCMYLARQMTSQSLEQIGGYFGNRDHTTVLHASRAIGEVIKNDPEMNKLVEQTAEEARHAGR
jgi:chromosomal replication initiator protein